MIVVLARWFGKTLLWGERFRVDAERDMTPTKTFADDARSLGKAARTRARLMDAALGLFAREGFDAASVNAIAHAADVVNGTFYLHFKDKDEIAAAVVSRIAADITRQLDEAMEDVDDAIERTACATRRFIEFAAANADWGWAIVKASLAFRDFRGNVLSYLRADLKRGVRQGAFSVTADDFLVDMFASMTLAALVARLEGREGAAVGSRTAELQLRMLGVSAARAHKTAWRKLPALKLAMPGTP